MLPNTIDLLKSLDIAVNKPTEVTSGSSLMISTQNKIPTISEISHCKGPQEFILVMVIGSKQ